MGRGILSGIRTYREWAESLAREYKSSRFLLFWQLLFFRAIAKLGPPWFDAYGIHNKGLLSYKNFVPIEECRATLQSFAPVEHRHLEESKATFAAACSERGIPCVDVEAFISFEDTVPPAGVARVLESPDHLNDYFHHVLDLDAVVKPDGGGQGYGLYRISVNEGKLVPAPGYGNCEEFLDFLAASYPTEGGFVIQRRLTAHQGMADLFPGAGLGTVRINSFLMRDGSVEVPWAVLKIPGPESLHDNWRMGVGHGLLCPVDTATGALGRGLGRDTPRGPLKEYPVHPITGVVIEGRELPHWEEVKNLIPRIAPRFPELPALGWDIVISDSGPVVLEANWRWTIASHQIVHRRGMRKDFEDIMSRVASPRPYSPSPELPGDAG